MEKDFNVFHGDGLAKSPYVFKTLFNIISPKIDDLDIPEEVILCLIRIQTYIHLNNLNKDLEKEQTN